MNFRQRVEMLFKGQRPDRIAVLPQIGDHAGWVHGLTMDVIYHDPDKIAAAHLKTIEDYGYDIPAIQVEPSWPVAEACGCSVTYPPDKCPWITDNVIKKPEDVDRVVMPDFWAHPATGTILKATRKVKDEIGSDFLTAGYMSGPLTFALQLMPYNDFIIKTRKDPSFVEAVVQKAAEVVKHFAMALRDAGAEILVICEHDLQMFSPKAFHDYIIRRLPGILEVMDYNVLHTCGKVEAHLAAQADALSGLTGLQFLNFSPEVSITKMVEAYGGRMSFCGNIDHIHLLPNGDREEILAACRAAIQEGLTARTFMLGPGCEITIDTPPDNIKAFVQSAALYGGYAG